MAKKRRNLNEGLQESMSHEMGLQIPRCLHPEKTQESDLWEIAQAIGDGVARASRAKGVRDRGGASATGPRARLHQHPAEIRSVQCSGIHQREERNLDRAQPYGKETQLFGRKLLGSGLLRFDGGIGRGGGARVYPQSGKGGGTS